MPEPTSPPIVDSALKGAVLHLLAIERKKHLPLSIDGKKIDELIINLDPTVRAGIIARQKAEIDAKKANLAKQLADIQAASDSLDAIAAETDILALPGGAAPVLTIEA